MTISATRAGTILGTAAYMAPEQARGNAVDKRVDIWAFGVVLYEMLTGKQLFEGETLSDILAAVLRAEPDFSAIPPDVKKLLRACLQKSAQKRLRDIGDATLLIQQPPPAAASRPSPWLWSTIALAIVSIAAGFFAFRSPTPPARTGTYRLDIDPPPGKEFDFGVNSGGNAISPDGTKVLFSAGGQLWLRAVESAKASPLAGTSGAYYPFWSPDNRSFAFFESGKLVRFDLAAGAITELARLDGSARGGAWSRSGIILFSQLQRPLMRISAAGGRAEPWTSSDRAHGVAAPVFLPDGDRFLYRVFSGDPAESGIYAGSLKDKNFRVRVLEAPTNPAFLPASNRHPAYVLYSRSGTLLAKPIDPVKLVKTGQEQVVSETIGFLSVFDLANFSVSETGTILAGTLGSPRLQPAWFARDGQTAPAGCPPDYYLDLRLSPDGNSVALTKPSEARPVSLWTCDLKRELLEIVDEDGRSPAWAADSRQLIYFRTTARALVRKNLASVQPAETVAQTELGITSPIDLSPDGRFVITQGMARYSLGDTPVQNQPTRLATGNRPRISPDGRWLAYTASPASRSEVFVQSFPDAKQRVQVSKDGGRIAVWRRDGQELFYVAEDGRWMAVDVKHTGSQIFFGSPHALFRMPSPSFSSGCETGPDGKRFLCLAPPSNEPDVNRLSIILNWPDSSKN